MLRSLMSGVSGARGHQTFLDVVGNNIANINTVGFKKSNVTFQDLLYQTHRGAMPPGEGRGGVNSVQVGLGVRVAAIETIHTQGNINFTGGNTDVAIQGEGYFVVMDGNNRLYTRGGNFTIDSDNKVVQSGTGYRVQGFQMVPDPTNPLKYNRSSSLTDIAIPVGSKMEARATQTVGFRCNLDSRSPVVDAAVWDHATWDPYADPPMDPPPTASSHKSQIEIFDSLGNAHNLEVLWVHTGNGDPNEWSWVAYLPDGNPQFTARGSLTFGPDGKPAAGAVTQPQVTIDFTPLGAASSDIVLDFAGESFEKPPIEGVTQYGSPFTTKGYFQDGCAMGVMDSFSVSADGTVVGTYDNGQNIPLYKLSLATFINPSGLTKVGDTVFRESTNSGLARIGVPLEDGAGALIGGALEMSNIDLTEEFTRLILAQRGFQANARVINTSDQVLEEQINIKR